MKTNRLSLKPEGWATVSCKRKPLECQYDKGARTDTFARDNTKAREDDTDHSKWVQEQEDGGKGKKGMAIGRTVNGTLLPSKELGETEVSQKHATKMRGSGR